jgi:hypothetical protein
VLLRVATDAFGNALGSSLADAMTPKENPYSIGGKALTGAERLAQGGSGVSFGGFQASDLIATGRAADSPLEK